MLKPIPNFKNYLIDENGNVFSKQFNKFMKQRINESGYAYLQLKQNTIPKKCYIHRLVALTFIPNFYNLPEINHKDENKLNNNVNNLEWCDKKYNFHYGTAIQRIKEKLKGKSTCGRKIKSICQYDINFNFIKEYKSMRECDKFGFNHSEISKCCNNKNGRKTHKGYIWRYKENELHSNNN